MCPHFTENNPETWGKNGYILCKQRYGENHSLGPLRSLPRDPGGQQPRMLPMEKNRVQGCGQGQKDNWEYSVT